MRKYRGIAYNKGNKNRNNSSLLKDRWIDVKSGKKSPKKQYRGKFY